MQTLTDCLLILGLTSCKSLEVLKSAYRREMHRWHPDHHYDDPAKVPVANERTRKIKEAYEYLSNNFASAPHGAFKAAQHGRARKPRYGRKKRTGERASFVTGFPDPEVEETFVESNHILSAGYDFASRILYLKFHDHSVYGYSGVPEEVFKEFLGAESRGQFARRYIFGCYQTERCS